MYSTRNVFRLRPTQDDFSGAICYGDHFYIVSELPEGELFLCSEKPSLFGGNGISKRSNAQLVSFARRNPGYNGEWEVVFINPEYRPESEGHPVNANEPVLLRHCASNQMLCNLTSSLVRSEFGVETEVVCQTKLDRKVEIPDNHWVLEMRTPTEDAGGEEK